MTEATISQRDFMRQLVMEVGHDKDAVCAAYSCAEIDGRVGRVRNDNDLTPAAYAAALWHDGMTKGWLTAQGPVTDDDLVI